MSQVSISLQANTANYVQRLRDARTETDRNLIRMEQRVDKFARDVNGNFTSVEGSINTMLNSLARVKGGGYIAGAAILTGTTAQLAASMHQMSVQVVQNENALKLAAQQANITVDELRTLAAVTNTVGINFEKFGDMSKDVQDKLGDFITNGTGGFEDFFNVVGKGSKVTASSLQKMASIDVLKTMVAEMENAGATSAQMINALESVASDSSNLLPYLRDGAKGFDELQKKMEKISKTPLLTEEAAKDIHVLDTAFNSMWDSFEVLMTQKFAKLSDFLTEMAAEVNASFNQQIMQEQGKQLGDKVKSGNHKINGNASKQQLQQEYDALQWYATQQGETGRQAQGDKLKSLRQQLKNTYGGTSSIKGKDLASQIKRIEDANKGGVVLDEFKVSDNNVNSTLKEYEAALKAKDATGVTQDDVNNAGSDSVKKILEERLKEQEAAKKAEAKIEKDANDKKAKAQSEADAKALAAKQEAARKELQVAQAKVDTAITIEDQINAQHELDLLKAEQKYKDEASLKQFYDDAVLQADYEKFNAQTEIKNQHIQDDNVRDIENLEAQREFWNTALEEERITEEEHKALMLQNEAAYTDAKRALTMSQLDSISMALSGISGLAEKGSSAYKALFAVEKAATIAKLGVQMWDAWGAVDNEVEVQGSGIAKTARKAAVVAQYGGAIASVASQAIGQFHSGTDYVPEQNDGSSFILQAGERVVQRAANKDLTDYLSASKSGGSGASVNAPLNIQGDTTISEAKLMSMMVKQRDQIAKMVKMAQREDSSLR